MKRWQDVLSGLAVKRRAKNDARGKHPTKLSLRAQKCATTHQTLSANCLHMRE